MVRTKVVKPKHARALNSPRKDNLLRLESLKVRQQRRENTNTIRELQSEEEVGGDDAGGGGTRSTTTPKSTDLLIRKAPFRRLVLEIVQKVVPVPYHVEERAVAALQEAAENRLIYLFKKAHIATKQAGRVTVMPRDIQSVRHMFDFEEMNLRSLIAKIIKSYSQF